MDTSDLITALTGGSQYTLMSILLDPLKDELIAKAIADRALMSKQA
jgi:hypothetical protein